MSEKQSAEPVTAVGTLEKLSKLSRSRISATSPQRRVRVTLQGDKYSVDIRPEGFQRLDPEVLAEEVAHGVRGTLRGFHQAKQQVLAKYRATRPEREPVPDEQRERIRRAQETVSVKATSPGRLVRGTWAATDGVQLKITAVNESHRVQLAEEIGTVLTELSARFRAQMRDTVSAARQRLREEAH